MPEPIILSSPVTHVSVDTEKAYGYCHTEVGEHCKVWLYWGLPPTVKNFTKGVEMAKKVGAKQLLFWESDYMDLPERASDAEKLTKAMAAHTAT